MKVLLDHVTRRINGVTIVDDVNAELSPKTGTLLIGDNGSGKTSLVRLIVGLDHPTTGAVTIDGLDPNDAEFRHRIAYVPDQPVLYRDLSAGEQVEFVAALYGGEWQKRVQESYERFGLEPKAHLPPPALSRGWRQRLSLALAWVKPFSLVVIDEPWVGLDANGRDALLSALADVRESGRGFIVVTHEPGPFGPLVSEVAEMAEGRLSIASTGALQSLSDDGG